MTATLSISEVSDNAGRACLSTDAQFICPTFCEHPERAIQDDGLELFKSSGHLAGLFCIVGHQKMAAAHDRHALALTGMQGGTPKQESAVRAKWRRRDALSNGVTAARRQEIRPERVPCDGDYGCTTGLADRRLCFFWVWSAMTRKAVRRVSRCAEMVPIESGARRARRAEPDPRGGPLWV